MPAGVLFQNNRNKGMAQQKLVIIHQGALGDFIAIIPAVYRLRERFERVDVVCQSQLGKLAQYLGLVTRSYPLEAAFFSSLFTNQPAPEIQARFARYDHAILFSSSVELESSVRHIMQHRYNRLESKPPAGQSIHITTYVLQNLIRCGLIRPEDPTSDRFYPPSYMPKKSNGRVNRNKILLHPGSGSKRKRWPLSQFKQIESRLSADGLKTEFVLGPAEEDLHRQLQGRNRIIHMLDDLIELVQLYQTANGYIGNDSGASHLAAFLGLPTLVIFGPADPDRWKPNGTHVAVVRPPLTCQPCFETEPANCPEPKCLQDITADSVLKAFYTVYEG
jgi:ADP-heptose:LPS heptosyltransferase